jgi:AsmA-like C-terminal region
LKKIAPIAGIINGKISSTINLSGNLDAKEMTPDLKTMTGDLLGQLIGTSVNAEKSTLLSSLNSNFKFIDINKLNLKDLKAALTFENGKVNVKPFDIKYQDIKATIGGSHGFDQLMNYTMKLDVPAKYLGTEANALLAKLSPSDLGKLENIPINAIIGGNFTNPKITTDMKQLVKQQKDKLIKEGTTKLGALIDKNIKKPGDTTKTVIPTTKAEVKEAIKEKAKEEVTKKAGDLLNGLFGKKKE